MSGLSQHRVLAPVRQESQPNSGDTPRPVPLLPILRHRVGSRPLTVITRLGVHAVATALPDSPQADRVRHRVRVGGRPRLLPRGRSTAKASPVACPPVVAYADLTLLGGRHRQRDVKPEGHPELHPIAERLVCASISDGNSGFPAVLRDCGCGKQLWVSTAMLELVDARTLHAVCLGCHLTDRKPLELHSASMPTLHLIGRSADAWRCVAMLNGLACSA